MKERIRDLAFFYPEVAIALLSGARPRPKTIPIKLQFDATTGTAIGDFTDGAPRTAIAAPTIVESIVFTIECPLANPGNLFARQVDTNRTLNPYVDVSVQIPSDSLILRYNLDVSPTALIALASTAQFRAMWPCGWLLEQNQSPNIHGTLQRQLEDQEVPFNVKIVLNGWDLLDPEELFRTWCRTPVQETRDHCLKLLQSHGVAA